MSPPAHMKKTAKQMHAIVDDVEYGIKQLRSSRNFKTKFKNQRDPIVSHFIQLLRLQEYQDTKREGFAFEFRNEKKKIYQWELDMQEKFKLYNSAEDLSPFFRHWQKKLKWLMPTNWICRHVQQFFNFTDNEMIRAKVKDRFRGFILVRVVD